jgi:hypothetical protein
VKFITRSKIARDLWIPCKEEGDLIPFEVYLLKKLRHPNIISYIEHFMDEKYVILVTELHGTPWDATNPDLDAQSNPGIKISSKRS